MLDHAIRAGGVTTIEYLGSNTFAQYTAHPANSNADSNPHSDTDTRSGPRTVRLTLHEPGDLADAGAGREDLRAAG